jgi:8-amino-7-oxononanoate synthase
MRIEQELAAGLADLAAAGRARRRRIVERRDPDGVHVHVDGRDCVAFCGNDYLGLSGHPAIVAAFQRAADEWGVGSGASHLVSGHDREHHALEEELAELVGRPRALLFSTGYMANLALGAALAGRGDLVLEDRLNHASLLDAGLASGARLQRYAHADVGALRRRLQSAMNGARRRVVLTDGVFSMDGDVAPLPALAEACREFGAALVVDDAHGFGLLGPGGAGSVAEAGLCVDAVPALMCTLGKAVGTFGAFVAGSQTLIEALLQRSRTYIYTTALPPAVAAATRAAVRLMRDEPWRRDHVLRRAARFRGGAANLGLSMPPSRTAIQPVIVGSEAAAVAASDALLDEGYWVPAIRPPTVPAGTSRLRVTFSASHSDADVDRLLEAFARLPRRGAFDSGRPA